MIDDLKEYGKTTIRMATSRDVPVIKAIAREAYSVYIDRIGREPAPIYADYAAHVNNCYVFVISDKVYVVGYIVFWPRSDHFYIDSVALRSGYRGRGLGRRLIDYVESKARLESIKALELCTNQKMYENLKMYPKLGFEIKGTGIEDGYERVYFRKELS